MDSMSLLRSVKDYTSAKTAEITWVPEEKIVGAARAWAHAKSGLVQWGLAVDTTKESLPAAQAIGALWQIVESSREKAWLHDRSS